MFLQINRKSAGKEYYDMIECTAVYMRFEEGHHKLYYNASSLSEIVARHKSEDFYYTNAIVIDHPDAIFKDIINVAVWHPERREVLWYKPREEDNVDDVIDTVQKKTSEFLMSARDRYRDMTS